MSTALPKSTTRTAAGDAPTAARRKVVAFAVLLAVITYIDRVCISQAAPAMQADMGLSPKEMGWAFSAFVWAYAVFEIPGGWLGDRIGARRVLVRVVLWWSAFTAATGWVFNAVSLVVTRTLFGAGEAGCFPNLTRAFTTWLPGRERERAQAILWLSARWGGAFTPLLVAGILQFVSWRRAFEIFGCIGLVWAFAFYRWYRDDPADHPDVNEAELAIIPPRSETARVHGAIPWGRFGAHPATWLLWVQYFCLSYSWTFYITWLPTYLRDARHTATAQGALLAGLPLFLGGIGCLVSGYLTHGLSGRMSVRTARTALAATGFFAAAICVLLFLRIADPTVAMIVLGISSFFNDFVMPPAWAACMDVGGRYSGTLSGSMNMMGNLGGGASAILVPYLLSWTGQNWAVIFYIFAAVYVLGGVCWLFLDSTTPMDRAAASGSIG